MIELVGIKAAMQREKGAPSAHESLDRFEVRDLVMGERKDGGRFIHHYEQISMVIWSTG